VVEVHASDVGHRTDESLRDAVARRGTAYGITRDDEWNGPASARSVFDHGDVAAGADIAGIQQPQRAWHVDRSAAIAGREDEVARRRRDERRQRPHAPAPSLLSA
jgi:hypothetical protein